MRGEGGVAGPQPVQLYTGGQINFGDLTPYLTYDILPLKEVLISTEITSYVKKH